MFLKLKNLLITFLFFITFILGVQAIEHLEFDGFIADNADILSNQTKNEINQVLSELQNKTNSDIAVVTLDSLDGEILEDVTLKIARDYKIGSKESNTGALILVVLNDRKVRIEIGYGLEDIITDAHSGKILDDYIIPRFKNGDYEMGIYYGTLALANDIAEAYNQTLSISNIFEQEFEPERKAESMDTNIFTDDEIPLIIKIIFAIALMALVYVIFMIISLITLNISYFAVLLLIPLINILIVKFHGKPINKKRIAKKIEKLIKLLRGNGSSGGGSSGSSYHGSSHRSSRSSSHFGGGGGFGGGGSSRSW